MSNNKCLLHLRGTTLVLFSNYFFLAIDELELLHPSAEIGLRHVDIAFGIHCQSMTMGEITQLVPRTAETLEYSSAGVIKNMNDLIAAVHDIHVFLLPIPGKTHPPRGAPRIRQFSSSGPDPDVSLKVPHLVEHLNAIA